MGDKIQVDKSDLISKPNFNFIGFKEVENKYKELFYNPKNIK